MNSNYPDGARMGSAIRINVYQGDRVELLPAMCMFCGHSLGEEQYQPVQMQLGGAVRPLALPICLMDKIPDQVLQPDGGSDPVAGVNPQRYQPYLVGTFAFQNVTPKFAQELDRLRNLPHDQYDPQVAQSNERIQAMLQGPSTAATVEAEERRRQMETQEAEDEAAFQLEKAAGTGEVTRAETKASSRKLILISLIAGAVGLLLVMCITVGVIGTTMLAAKRAEDRRAFEEEVKKKENVPKEIQAKIKVIDRERGSITLLDKNSKRATYRIDNGTEFFDRDGNRMPQGITDPKVKEEEYCVILPTLDRQALQSVKLTAPPK
jgi:hypothetical protein